MSKRAIEERGRVRRARDHALFRRRRNDDIYMPVLLHTWYASSTGVPAGRNASTHRRHFVLFFNTTYRLVSQPTNNRVGLYWEWGEKQRELLIRIREGESELQNVLVPVYVHFVQEENRGTPRPYRNLPQRKMRFNSNYAVSGRRSVMAGKQEMKRAGVVVPGILDVDDHVGCGAGSSFADAFDLDNEYSSRQPML